MLCLQPFLAVMEVDTFKLLQLLHLAMLHLLLFPMDQLVSFQQHIHQLGNMPPQLL